MTWNLVEDMARQLRYLPAGHSFHITLRCNSRQFLIAKGLRRDVLLAVLAKAKQKVPHKLYAACLRLITCICFCVLMMQVICQS